MSATDWFSFFREGVQFLGEGWQKSKTPEPLFADNPRNALRNRHIAIQKAKQARRNCKGERATFYAMICGRAMATGQGALSGWMPRFKSFNSAGFCFPPVSGSKAHKRQWLPTQSSGYSKVQHSGNTNAGMESVLFRGMQARYNACKPRNKPFVFEDQKPPQVVGGALQQGPIDFDKKGVTSSLHLPPKLSGKRCIRCRQETKKALEALGNCINAGAVNEINPSQYRNLIPW